MFWELIAANRRRSFYLITFMAASLLGIGWAVGFLSMGDEGGLIGIAAAAVIWFFLTLISLSSGDSILLSSVGAKEVSRDVHPQLFNIVEEMRIASGLRASPRIYVVEDLGMNAFATGLAPERSAVAVTAGLLARMNRDELQGVMAHEMSHIANRDMRYMTIAGVMLGSLQLLTRFFFRGLGFTGRAGKRVTAGRAARSGGPALIPFIVLAILLAVLGPVLAQIFYFSLSRKREYLADACAVRLTRYPEGLADALEKIAEYSSHLDSANEVTAPMYIANPFGESTTHLFSWFSTHPPVEDRIAILRGMTHGVNFSEYENIFTRIMRGRRIIPRSGLKTEALIGLRAPMDARKMGLTPEQAQSQKSRETLDLLRAVNRYAFLLCDCGLKIKLPPDFKETEVECPRCAKKVRLPHAEVMTAGEVIQAEPAVRAAARKVREAAAPGLMEYRRRGRAEWETFECTCGTRLQLSPSFLGTHLDCGRCGRQVLIHAQAAS